MTGKVNREHTEITETLVLEEGAKEPAKQKITYISDKSVIRIAFPGKPEKTIKVNGPFEGKSVLVQNGAGKVIATLEAGNPDPVQASLLQSWPSGSEYPEKRIAAGESWTVTGPALRKIAGLNDAQTFQGTATFTLERIVTVNNESCALIQQHMEIKATVLGEEKEEIQIEMSLTGHTYHSLVTSLDVESEVTGPIKMTLPPVIEEGERVDVTITGTLTVKTHDTITPPKGK